jgi:hypothetical protein
MQPSASISIRPAFPDDFEALIRLAALDSASPLAGSVLLAEENGQLRAAIGVGCGRVIADPFVRTAGLVAILRLRADEHARAAASPTTRSRGRGRRPLLQAA